MANLDNEYEKGPAIFKEEIIVEDHVVLPTEEETQEVDSAEETTKHGELKRQGTESSEEYVPEITGVEFDAFLIPKKGEAQITADFESKTHARQPLGFTADIEVDEQKEKAIKPEIDLKEEYGFQIPKEHYITDKQFGVDMSVRTEDEVSELPDSEIASLMSDRKAELERRDSDVSLSDREYSDKDDENVIISDTESVTESPFTAKQVIKLDDEKVEVVEDKSESSEGSSREQSSSSEEKESHKDSKEVDNDIGVNKADQEVLDESFDESESLGAIPAKVYGDQYMQEINRLRDRPFTQGPEQYQTTEELVGQIEETPAGISGLEKVKPKVYDKPVRHVVTSENESSESSESEESDEYQRKKKYVLDSNEREAIDKLGTVPEVYLSGDNDERPPDGEYPYGKGLPVPRLKLKRESSDSESDMPVETDESMFDATTDLETTVDLESTLDKGESPEAAAEASDRDTPGKTTDEDSSTIKDEFITHVDSLEMKPEHSMEVREYVSSEEEEGQKPYQPLIRDEDERSETPEIHTGFSAELELSRITEDEEPESDESSESSSSAESVRQVDIPLRDEVLQTVPEESESADVSMEIPHEGEISDTSFDVDESFNIEGPLARSTMVREQHTHLEVIFG